MRSEIMPDGSYRAAITVGADTAFALDHDQALAYTTACMARATEADHDTAVMRLFTSIGLAPKITGEFIGRDLRPDRPDTHAPTEPLRFLPTVGRARHPRPDAGQYIPIILMELHGKDIGSISPDDLRRHGSGVLGVLAAVELDERLFRFLTKRADLDEDTARAVVGSLAEHMPADE